ncbi:MAG: nuclear transport factor 2 family protein [Gemmatimonadales bacterium]
MLNRPHLLATALLLCTAACTSAPDPATERATLLAADVAFDTATAARGLEGWVSFVADSGRQIDRQGNFVTGPSAIRAHMRGLLSDTLRSLRWVPDLADVSGDGTLGYTWGRWTMTVRDSSGSRPAGQGRYLTIWRKQRDGRWKVEGDVGTETE